jgi:MYXO-CTERM domain-containing protein
LITGLNWAPGQSHVLRWVNTDMSGQDNGLAVDNLAITGVVPAPGALALLGLAGLTATRRHRHS